MTHSRAVGCRWSIRIGTDTITKLAKPGTPAGEVLTFAASATAPSWVAASAGVGIGLVLALGG